MRSLFQCNPTKYDVYQPGTHHGISDHHSHLSGANKGKTSHLSPIHPIDSHANTAPNGGWKPSSLKNHHIAIVDSPIEDLPDAGGFDVGRGTAIGAAAGGIVGIGGAIAIGIVVGGSAGTVIPIVGNVVGAVIGAIIAFILATGGGMMIGRWLAGHGQQAHLNAAIATLEKKYGSLPPAQRERLALVSTQQWKSLLHISSRLVGKEHGSAESRQKTREILTEMAANYGFDVAITIKHQLIEDIKTNDHADSVLQQLQSLFFIDPSAVSDIDIRQTLYARLSESYSTGGIALANKVKNTITEQLRLGRGAFKVPDIAAFIDHFPGNDEKRIKQRTNYAFQQKYGIKYNENDSKHEAAWKSARQSIVYNWAYDTCLGIKNSKTRIITSNQQYFFAQADLKKGQTQNGVKNNLTQLKSLPTLCSQLTRSTETWDSLSFQVDMIQNNTTSRQSIKALEEHITDGNTSNAEYAINSLAFKYKGQFSYWLHNQFTVFLFDQGPLNRQPNFNNARLYLDVKPGWRAKVAQKLALKLAKLNNNAIVPIHSFKIASETVDRNDNVVIYFHMDQSGNPIMNAKDVLEVIADLQHDPELQGAFRDAKTSPLPQVAITPKTLKPLTGVRLAPEFDDDVFSVSATIANVLTDKALSKGMTSDQLNNEAKKVINELYVTGFQAPIFSLETVNYQ